MAGAGCRVREVAVRRILVAEDDPDLAELIAFVLGRAGHAVHHVPDGAGALRRACPACHALVLLDLRLPGTDGRGFLAARRADPALAALPVVAMSAEEGTLVETAQEYGLRGALRKPFTGAQLGDVVARWAADGHQDGAPCRCPATV